ncbi:MAG: hypothetical protein D6748_14335 [Calditrichaeota bacterium]|nr:MAG: hypothetical protein D6748_14335 [Calditrichota bacterium]
MPASPSSCAALLKKAAQLIDFMGEQFSSSGAANEKPGKSALWKVKRHKYLLMQRIHHLAQSACTQYATERYLSGLYLTRGVLETVARLHQLHKLTAQKMGNPPPPAEKDRALLFPSGTKAASPALRNAGKRAASPLAKLMMELEGWLKGFYWHYEAVEELLSAGGKGSLENYSASFSSSGSSNGNGKASEFYPALVGITTLINSLTLSLCISDEIERLLHRASRPGKIAAPA